MTDYYEVLNVPRDATSADIRNAYRRLARQWHPDKNLANKGQATKKFAEISQAYEVLSDERRKNIYDQTSVKGLQQNGGTRTFIDPEKLFKDFFGDDDSISVPNWKPSLNWFKKKSATYSKPSKRMSGEVTYTDTVTKNGKTWTIEKVYKNGYLKSHKIDGVSKSILTQPDLD